MILLRLNHLSIRFSIDKRNQYAFLLIKPCFYTVSFHPQAILQLDLWTAGQPIHTDICVLKPNENRAGAKSLDELYLDFRVTSQPCSSNSPSVPTDMMETPVARVGTHPCVHVLLSPGGSNLTAPAHRLDAKHVIVMGQFHTSTKPLSIYLNRFFDVAVQTLCRE